MKELSIEEKAKAYDEAYKKVAIRFGSNVADEIFLKESEDEKIRKKLKHYLEVRRCQTNDGEEYVNCNHFLAWLEKQGTSYTKRDVGDAYLKGISDAKNEIEKQYEANYQIRKDIATFIFNYRGDIKDRAKWLNYLGIKVFFVEKQGEQKPKKCMYSKDNYTDEDRLTLCDGCDEDCKLKQKPMEEHDVCDTCDEQAGCVNPCPMKLVEQNPANKVGPKFHEGDWVVFNNKHQSIYQVEKIEDGYYILRHIHGGTFRVCVLHDESLRLWTIQDAEAGDVLSYRNGQWIFIFKKNKKEHEIAYHALISDKGLTVNDVAYTIFENAIVPITKEQRDLLFQKIKEEGYEWDAEKKELKKIEQNPKDDELLEFKDKLCELFQRFRWYKDGTPTNGDILEYVEAHIQELLTVANKQKSVEFIQERKLRKDLYQLVYDCAWAKVTCKVEGETQEEYAERYTKQILDTVRDWADDYIDNSIERQLRRSYDKGREEALNKQKPVEWNSDDEQYLLICKNALSKYQVSDKWDANIISRWLESRLKSPRPQPKPAWSEEDEYYYGIIQYILNNECVGEADKENAINWFKSFKDRCLPQPQQKWSEEDASLCARIQGILSVCKSHNLLSPDLYKEMCDWLKSLRPQNKNEMSKQFEDTIREIKTSIVKCNGFNRKHREEVFSLLDSLRPLGSQLKAI